MKLSSFQALVLRFIAGLTGAVVAGALASRATPIPSSFLLTQSVLWGSLAAAILGLVRVGRTGAAVLLALAFSLSQAGMMAFGEGPLAGLLGLVHTLVLTGGLVLISIVFDILAEHGYRVGKFLLFGAMFGGLYLAVTPLMGLIQGNAFSLSTSLWGNAFLGILIGDGVGFGVEMVDLVDARDRVEAEQPAAPDAEAEVEKKTAEAGE